MTAALSEPLVTIDLGVVETGNDWGDADADRAAPLARGWGLLLGLAAVAILTAATPLPPQPTEIARIQLGGYFSLSGHSLYLLEGSRTPTRVTAVDAADGHRRWQYVAQSTVPLANVETVGDTVLLSPDSCSTGAAGSTAAVEADTGRELWRRVGVPLRTSTGSPVAVLTQGSWSDRCGAMLGNGRALTGALRWDGVDRHSGAVRWEVSLAPGTLIALDSEPAGARWAALLDADDRVFVVDLATGTRSSPVRGIADRHVSWFTAVHGLVLVSRIAPDRPGGVDVTAVDRDTLAPKWTVWVGAPNRTQTNRIDTVSVRPCGPAVCVVADDTTAIDPATGEVRWHTVRAAFTEVPGGLLADYSVGTSSGAGSSSVFIHDPSTGRLTASLDGWRLVGIDEPGRRLLVGESTGDSTVLAWLSGAGLEPLAVLPGRFDACLISVDRLVCQTNVDELWILRLRRHA